MLLLNNPGDTAGLVLDTNKDISVLIMAPMRPKRSLEGNMQAFLRENGVMGRLASIHYLSHVPVADGKAECPLTIMKAGWERVKRELQLVPNVKRVLFFTTTKALRVLFPGLKGGVDDAHGTLFEVEIGENRRVIVVPTFLLKDWELHHVKPWMQKDILRLLKLSRPEAPLAYSRNEWPEISQLQKVVVDIETTGFNPSEPGAHITTIGLQWDDNGRALVTEPVLIDLLLSQLAFSSNTHIWFHNAQFDIGWFGEDWIRKTYGRLHCTMMRAKANGELVNSLKHLGNYYTARPGNYAWHKPGNTHEFNNPDYVCEDIDVTWRLSKIFKRETPIIWLAERVMAMNAVQTLHGSKLDQELMKTIVDENAHAIELAREQLTEKWGVDPNRIEAFIEVLRARGYELSKKTKKGRDALTAEVLTELGLLDELDYRQLQKMDSAFAGKMLGLLRSDGTIPHHQSLLNAKSGRSTMSELNWQQLPRKGPSKRLLISRFCGGKITQVDLGQAELRVAAYEADDNVMAHWLLTSADPHKDNAAEAFATTFDAVTKDQRQDSKTLIFRNMYGGKALNDAQRRVEKFLTKKYQKLYQYLSDSKLNAMANNYTVDPMGKVCNLLDTFDYRGKWGVGRSGTNAPIQGVASHISQYITLRIWEEFWRRGMQSLVLFGVHDSTVIDTHPDEVNQVLEVIGWAFEQALEWLKPFYALATYLPMIGEVLIGTSWGDTKSSEPTLVSTFGNNPKEYTTV